MPAFSKIIEKVAEIQFSFYLNENKLLSVNQFGFRPGTGTEHAVHAMARYIHNAFDKNEFALGVLVDVKKAFDSLDRSILIAKLGYYGLKATELSWFASYLSNRRQMTVYKDSMSNALEVGFGVPTGGIISPLLFCTICERYFNLL